MTGFDAVFDDIVVGAGASGTVLAARLSEEPARRVLLLEAGPDHATLQDVPLPLRDARCAVFSGFHWPFSAQLRATDGEPGWPYGLGRVVGGSTAVNAALALRPSPRDFDRWAQAAGPAWTWEAVLPHFIRLEHDQDFGGPLHGTTGPLPIARPAAGALSAPQQAFGEACRSLGLAGVADLNADAGPGVGPVPSNALGGKRLSTALAYLLPARGRRNLSVRGDHEVQRVLFQGRRAVGVEVLHGGQLLRLGAGRVSLCAGAIHTTALLLRSGIGDTAECRRLGTGPVAHLPGVGQGLMDHPAVVLWMRPQAPAAGAQVDTTQVDTTQAGDPQAVHQLLARARSGAGVGAGAGAGSTTEPDLTLFMLAGFPTAHTPRLEAMLGTPRAHGISVMLARPASQGQVRLCSAAPRELPRIELGLGSAPEDVDRLMAGVRLAWRIAHAAPLASHARSIFLWREATLASDTLLRSAVQRLMTGTWHAAGTARMGPRPDDGAVVDEHFSVHGVDGLRVVDASVMPVLPSVPTALACVMLGERAASWMAGD